ncbi:alpha/beta hydrolase [Dictyobacter formicarum]|uniref:Esterase n=1 Tax=Dictyobacter formicarum TaxID=2778368 RepID=A0ABQ3V9K3_9CHLR|nr:alpha/beta hydrolase [Dictyobacter formicarum]GHO82664.1 esterase [Dictyobacter formicarum]
MTPTSERRTMQLDPHILDFLQGLEAQGETPIYTLSPADARNVLLSIQRSVDVTTLPVDSENRIIRGGPTSEISLRIVRPQSARGLLPGVMYFHGGGWILGDKETHDRLVREIANGAQATVVFVDYARSPEVKYPVAIEQVYAATKWVAEHGASVGVDPSHLAVAGDSVGGNMVAVTTLLAKERGGPQIDFQILLYPVTDANLENQSYREFGENGYWLTREAMRWFWDSYAPAAERDNPTVSPLQASLDQLGGLPPALLLTNENDVLRDEGEAYAHKLMAAGVPVTATRLLGAIHDVALINPITETSPARTAIAQVNGTLRKVFAQ